MKCGNHEHVCLDLPPADSVKNKVDWWSPLDSSQDPTKVTPSLGRHQSVTEHGSNTTAWPFVPIRGLSPTGDLCSRAPDWVGQHFLKHLLNHETVPTQPSFVPTFSSLLGVRASSRSEGLPPHTVAPSPLYLKSVLPKHFLHIQFPLGFCFWGEGHPFVLAWEVQREYDVGACRLEQLAQGLRSLKLLQFQRLDSRLPARCRWKRFLK